MTAVTFDTLKLARKLQNAGFSQEQATGAAEALADVMSDQVVTAADLKAELAPIQVKLEMVQWMVGGIGFGVLLLIVRTFWSG